MGEEVIESIALIMWNRNRSRAIVSSEEIQVYLETNKEYSGMYKMLNNEEKIVALYKIKMQVLTNRYKGDLMNAYIKR